MLQERDSGNCPRQTSTGRLTRRELLQIGGIIFGTTALAPIVKAVTDSLFLPKPVEAFTPPQIIPCNIRVEKPPSSVHATFNCPDPENCYGFVQNSIRFSTAEEAMTDIPYPKETPTYAINTCAVPNYHIAGYPELQLREPTEIYTCYVGFSQNRTADLQVISDPTVKPSMDERMRALILACDRFDRSFTGGGYKYMGRLDLGGKAYLDLGNSQDYYNRDTLIPACLEATKTSTARLNYRPGQFSAVVFVYLTNNNREGVRWQNLGTRDQSHGIVLFAGTQALYLAQDKMDPGTAVVLAHEFYHTKGLDHERNTIMDEDPFATGKDKFWILKYSNQVQWICDGANIPDSIPLTKKGYLPIVRSRY